MDQTNIRAKTIKLLEENMGQKFHAIGFCTNLLGSLHQRHKQQKKKVDKLDIKIKTYTSKVTINNKMPAHRMKKNNCKSHN
jgi:hypothetical protein